MLVLKPTPFDG